MVKTVLLLTTNMSRKQDIFKKMSGIEGLYILVASDFGEALCLLSEIKFDLMIIDITIKGISFELCRKILVSWSIPVLFFNRFQVLDSGWDIGVEKVIGSKIIN